jgi:hypothetical protein
VHLLDDDSIFRNDNMVDGSVVPPDGRALVCAHQVTNLLEGVIQEATVTENCLLIFVGYCVNNRADLCFQFD